jgi:uracil-DNA glycosylase
MHGQVHTCTACVERPGCAITIDPKRVPRKLPKQASRSELLLVGEALGPGTQRLSGLPYLEPDGSLRSTGRTLDAFLGRFGYTIQPDGTDRYAYSTDLVRCFPHKPGFDEPRPPSATEVATCAKWLETEIAMLRPRVVILFGRLAVAHFFERYLGRRVRRLGDVAGGPYRVRVAGVDLQVFAVQHPSPLAAGRGRDELYAEVGGRVAELLTPTEG